MIWFLVFCSASAVSAGGYTKTWSEVCTAPSPMPNKATCDAVAQAMLNMARHAEYEAVRCIQERKR